MKQFRDYIIYNCSCIATKYDDHFPTHINYTLFNKIIKLFDLDEIMLLEYELFK